LLIRVEKLSRIIHQRTILPILTLPDVLIKILRPILRIGRIKLLIILLSLSKFRLIKYF